MISAGARLFVIERAGFRCEYCRLPQVPELPEVFHIEHVIARQHLGPDNVLNLALACSRCNSYKGPNLSGIDPRTKEIVLLFNPREQDWDEHFERVENRIVGKTPTGRATALLFKMNAERRVELRSELLLGDLWRD